jgi:spermidine/putrescine transport system ATP-binding protein
MFQDYALFPHMTLEDNVGFGLRMRGQSRSVRHAAAREMLALVGLEQERRKKPHELSGGQRQRVALARALAVKPEVLLLDEPLGALDLNLRRQMQDELKSIHRRVGTTFVHVTHDQEEAMAIADDIIVMNAGRVEDHGSPESIYLSPRSVFSAGFMGEANLLRGQVTAAGAGQLSVDTLAGAWTLPSAVSRGRSIQVRDAVGVCFRPEHVVVMHDIQASADRSSDHLNPQDYRQEACLPLGDCRLLEHAFFGTHQRCRFQGTHEQPYIVHLPQNLPLKDGQLLALGVRRASVVVLPQDAPGADSS